MVTSRSRPARLSATTTPPGIARASLPIVVRNATARAPSVDLWFEALDRRGALLTRDFVHLGSIAPGASTSTSVFDILSQRLAPQLKRAEFRVIDAATYRPEIAS